MKKLILMRHGHAASLQTVTHDKLRSLDAKGVRQVSVIGKKMVTMEIVPDYLICSDARRALESAGIIRDTLELNLEIITESRLYTASPELYVKIFQSIPDIYSSVMIIAHNPVMEEVVSLLTREKAGMGSSDLFEAQLTIDKWKDFTLSCSLIESQFIRAE